MNFTCCDKEPYWVENVPGKGYYFCQECRNEVLAPQTVEYLVELYEKENFSDLIWRATEHLLRGIP